MNWAKRRLGGLYGRLALYYFLVTLVAALTVSAAVALRPWFEAPRSRVQSIALGPLVEAQASQVLSPYLEQETPDKAALEDWALPGLLASLDAATGSQGFSVAAVTVQDGQLLAASPCESSPAQPPQAVEDCAAAIAPLTDGGGFTPQVEAAIQGALAGTVRLVGLPGDSQGGLTAVVVPVRSHEGAVLGASIVLFPGDLSAANPSGADALRWFITDFWHRLRPDAFYFLSLATVIGTLSGVLISRNLTRRLRRITQAATAWSRGELSYEVRDRSPDEVGQLARDLNTMAEQLQAHLETKRELAVVEERNRLARELHDSVKQNVFAAALLIRAARKALPDGSSAAQKYLGEAEELAAHTQQELVEMIHALRPAALAGKGLATVLREYVNDWSQRTEIGVDLRVEGGRATPLPIEEALYRVAQEALANVARHSEAKAVVLQLAWEGTAVRLSIRDNGKGFDPGRVEGQGLGLTSMRERVKALQGTLAISSSAAGTKVEAQIPCLDETATNMDGALCATGGLPQLASHAKGRITNE